MTERDRVNDDLSKFSDRIIKRLVVNVHAELVAPSSEGGTPRDTSFAAVNWIPDDRPIAEATGTPQSLPVGAAQAGLAKILGMAGIAGRTLYIGNGAKYIGRLNDGHSRQAAPGFVQRSIGRGVAKTQREARSIR